jgi:hypothetical protein
MESLFNFIGALLDWWFSDYDDWNWKLECSHIIEIGRLASRKTRNHIAKWLIESIEKFKSFQGIKSFKRLEFSIDFGKRCDNQRCSLILESFWLRSFTENVIRGKNKFDLLYV